MSPSRLYRRAARGGDERGQMVVLAALSMVAMLAFAALAIDIGLLTHQRRDLQNSADAMALAGSSQITTDGSGNGAAVSVAQDWASRNNVSDAEISSITFGQTCAGDTVDNSMAVHLTRTENTTLANVIGIRHGTVSVCASAARYSFGGGVGAAPFGVDQKCVYGNDTIPETNDTNEKHAGDWITIKYDSNNGDGGICDESSGNFWLLAIDDTGAGTPCGSPIPAGDDERKLREAICFGAITPLCSQLAVAEGENCVTNVDTETGNVSSIKDSMSYVLNNVPSSCNTMDEIISSTAPYALKDACNPFLPGYTSSVSLVKLIPVLDKLAGSNGKTNLNIVNFLIVVIDPTQIVSGWCQSGCEVKAKIAGISIDPQALRRALDDSSTNNFSVLVN